MSSQSPSDDIVEKTVRPNAKLRLPQNQHKFKLFRILKRAWKDLVAESCPRQPKSIYGKARVILRNLPHWREYVEELPMSRGGAQDYSTEIEACEEVNAIAKATIKTLDRLVKDDIADDEQAESEYTRLKNSVRSALGRIGGEFSPRSQTRDLEP